MNWKMAENSLFAILLRQDWWVSALAALVVFGLVQNFIPWVYALFATAPFTVLTIIVAWKQIRTPSVANLEKALENIRGLPWEDFAKALETGFGSEGYAVRRVDGAADFELEKLGYVTLVCARRWKVARTGVEPLKALVAAGEQRAARECRYAVAGELTDQARAYATRQGVKLVEGAELVRLVGG